jgi:hypothetical protein
MEGRFSFILLEPSLMRKYNNGPLPPYCHHHNHHHHYPTHVNSFNPVVFSEPLEFLKPEESQKNSKQNLVTCSEKLQAPYLSKSFKRS